MQVSLSTTPVRIDKPRPPQGQILLLRSATANIYIGGSDVTYDTDPETDGWPYMASDDPIMLPVPSGGLYARTSAGAATVEVLVL